MAEVVIDEETFIVRIYDDGDKRVSSHGCQKHITDAYVGFAPDYDLLHIKGNKNIYWCGWYDDERWFLRKKSAIDFIKKNKNYRMTDLTRWLFFWVVKPDDWRCIRKEPFDCTYHKIRIIDYRKGDK